MYNFVYWQRAEGKGQRFERQLAIGNGNTAVSQKTPQAASQKAKANTTQKLNNLIT
jgi:hypothetical protein